MSDKKALVVGSTVVYDYLFTVDRLPHPGKPGFIKPQPVSHLDKKYPGGTAFNIAVQLALLDEGSKILHPVGSDFPHSVYEEKLLKLGVDTQGLLLHPDSPSGFAYLFTNPAGETLIFTYPSPLPDKPIPEAVYKGVDWLVLTPSFGPLHEHSLKRFQAGSQSLAVVGLAHPEIIEWVNHIDLLSINTSEAQQLMGFAGFRTQRELARALKGVLIVTEGKRGCYVYEPEGKVTQLASITPEHDIDPTGAGDAFAAGVIASLRRGYPPVEAARNGTVTASYVVEAVGCQTSMPTWPEIFTRLDKNNTENKKRS